MTNPDNCAFPKNQVLVEEGVNYKIEWGLSKREYFAIQAFKAMIEIQYGNLMDCALRATTAADNLIEALNKK